MKSVKIGEQEYRSVKALAARRGLFLQHVLNEAIRQYLTLQGAPFKRDERTTR